MATTISCEVMRGGGAMPRATINGQQFIECDVLRGGGRSPDAKIGSKAQVLNVKSWSPDQDDTEIPHGHSVEVNVEALNTAEKDVHYDEGADFLGGTFSNMQVVGDELNLSTSPVTDDFEGYTIGQNLIGNGWTARTTATGWDVQQMVSGDSQHGRCQTVNSKSVMSLDAGPNVSDAEVLVRIRFADPLGQGGPCLRLTGSGSALRGYTARIERGSTFLQFKRFTGNGTTFGISSQTFGFTPAENEWIFIRFRITSTSLQAKVWKEGDAEPGTWKSTGDSVHAGPGVVGLFAQTGAGEHDIFFDDFSTETIPPSYVSSGSWEDSVDVSSVEHFSHGQVTWDETTPADTTAVVKGRWRSTDSWAAMTNGAIVPGIEYEQDMRAGATKDMLYLRVELATTDSLVTPSVGNLRVYFEPARDEAFKVTVHGEENTVGAQTLSTWGRAILRSAAGQPYIETADWSDLFMRTVKRWMARNEQTVTAAFSYWGNAIASITFEAEASKYRHGYLTATWVVPALFRESGPTIFEWTALTPWWPMGHNFEWNLIDEGQAIHADAYWVVGHAQIDDHPLSFLVSVPNITDHPLSVQVRGWQRDDHPLSMLIQGWQRDDYPLSFSVGVWTINDQPVSFLVAKEYLNDHPMSFLVYGVNRESMIEVNIIDDETWAELVARGYTRS